MWWVMGQFWGEICVFAVMSHILPKTRIFRLHFVTDTMGLASVFGSDITVANAALNDVLK